METLTHSTDTSAETVNVKTAKKVAVAAALKAMSLALKGEGGTKSKEHREKVAVNNAERLEKKLKVLTDGRFEHKGKMRILNVRATVIDMVKAARLGATLEQLQATGVATRFTWQNIEGPVRAYASISGEHSTVVLAVLYPTAVETESTIDGAAVVAEALEAAVAPDAESSVQAAEPVAKPAKSGKHGKKGNRAA
jgi:hypothetical protein